jgi:Flp pilus assembly protein TadD
MSRLSRFLAWSFAAPVLFADPVTFNKHIAPIVFQDCAPCHRPGESGPFSLLSYDDVKKHARQIVAVTKSRYMPPWLPEAGFGKFADERRLSDAQIRLFERWVEQGEAPGQAADLPPLPKLVQGWQLGEPDLVLRLPQPYTLAAGGSDVYRNFVFSFPLEGVRYVRALEIRPGNKRVVHHANLLIDRNRSSRWKDGRDGHPGFPGMDLKIEASPEDPESHLLFWKPGSVIGEEPEGMAWTIERGTDLILNMHLQPSGKTEIIEPSLGLYFTREPPRLRPLLVQLENDRALDIPAGAANFSVTDDFTLPVDVDLLAVYPHAHYLGKQVEAVATLPDGAERPLIRIRRWDLNWQAVYRYEKPVFLPKGTMIAMRWLYDNSSGNAANPNHPPQRVAAGDRSTDEMGHVWLQLLSRGPGDRRMAIQEALMRKRIGRDSDDFTAHFNLGGVLAAQGNPGAAIREFQEAVRVRPRDEVALNTLGAVLQLQQRADEAEALYHRALEARPDYQDAHYNLADLLLSRDRVEEAIPHLREVVRLQPSDVKARTTLAEALDTRAHQLARTGNLKEAGAAFRELVALMPGDTDAQTNLGVALAKQGQLEEAKMLFERALLLDPQNAAARQNLDRVNALLHP